MDYSVMEVFLGVMIYSVTPSGKRPSTDRRARDFERYARTAAAFIRLAMIRIMLQRLTKPLPCSCNPNFLDRLLEYLTSFGAM